jgi:hypothetical protein
VIVEVSADDDVVVDVEPVVLPVVALGFDIALATLAAELPTCDELVNNC